MITLFRRIRQKLIDSGSVTKYLLYAIGEILLVVIGILIALQVNNWNEDRKAAQEKTLVMQQLLEDARADSIFFLSRQEGLNLFQDSWTPLLQLEDDVRRDSVRSVMIPEGFSFFVIFIHESYLLNNNPDPFEKISDPELKDLLRDYKNHHIYVREAITQFNEQAERFGIPLTLDHGQILQTWINENATYGDAEELFRQEEIQSVIRFLITGIENSKVQNDRFLATNYALIRTLESKLAD